MTWPMAISGWMSATSAIQASTEACGDWSEDLAFTVENQTPKNFGCAVQHNIAAMVADPRDLLGPRADRTGDATRRATVIGNYEKGKPTAANKTRPTCSRQSAPSRTSSKQ